MSIPSLDELRGYNVNRPGQYEGIRQSMYDFTTYAAAGQTSLTFFQLPIGQSGKTKADTNMEAAGSLPAPKHFFVMSIEVHFWPGIEAAQFAAAASDLDSILEDTYTLHKSGYLDFFIGSKSYLTEAPVGRFPPKTRLYASSAVASNSATVGESKLDYAAMSGQPYVLDPGVLLVPTQNFNVTLNWPTAVALPSGNDGRIGIVLNGIQYRLSQ